jgi:hypothetical protein
MAFGSENDIKIRIEVDNAGAVRVLDQMGKKLGEFGTEAEKAGKEQDKLNNSIQRSKGFLADASRALGVISSSYLNVRTALVDLGNAAQSAFSLIADGAAIAQAEDAFDRLTLSAGTTSEVLLGKLRDATDGTISNFNLLKIANDGLIAGLKPEELETFAKAADAIADSTGGDAAAGLQRLSDAFARGRVEGVAAELGIRNYNAEIKKFADALGTTSDKLGEDARKLVERNILIDAVSKKTQQLGVNTIVNGDIVERWGVALQNSSDNLKTLLGRSTQLTAVLLGIEKVGSEVATVFETIAAKVEKAAQGTQKFTGYLQGALAAASPVAGTIGLFQAIGSEAAKKNELDSLFGGGGILGKSSGGAQFAATTDVAAEAAKRFEQTLKAVRKAMQESGAAAKDVKDKYDATGEAMVALYKANKELTSFEGIQKQTRQFQDLFKALNAGSITTDQYGKFFSETIKEAIDAGISPDDIARQVSEALEEAAGKVGQGQFSFADLLRKVVTDGGGGATEAQIAGDLAPTLEGAFGTASDLAISAIAGEDSTKLQRSKAIGAAIGGIIGGIIAGYVTAGIGTAAGAAIGSAIGEAIGGAVGKESKNAARKAKKAYDAALIEAFSKNPVKIVDPFTGAGEALKDLDFITTIKDAEKYSAVIDELVKSVGPELAGAFNTAAVALEQFAQELGIDADELRGVLFETLLGNLGANILNLKALFASLGKDAEDVRGLLYKAFLQGGISANELLTLLRQVQLIFSEGIPTAIGAVDEAFKQFQALAGKGGASSFEALKAIAVEALEAGATTFDQLANLLINQYGFAADQVNQLLQAMKLAGLNNLQDLAKASQETLLAVLSNIQELLKGGTNFVTGEAFAGLLPKPKSTGGGSRVDEAKEAAKATLAAVQATDEYKLAIDALRTGELSRAQVQKVVNGLVKEYTELTKAREDLESKLADILKKGGKITAEQARQLQKLTEAVENFGKVGEKGFRTFNKELVKFSKTVGDDLNKLILAANAAGISLEDLKKPIVEAFAAGKLSAEEAFKQLQKYEQGLGGVGNTAREALDNLLKAGTSGGAVSLDALKDIAGEAIKLGGQSILDLENQLRAQGVGDDRISQLLRAISDAGITSLDQLANANDETAIRIIAKAKEFGLPFQETGNEIKKLLDDLQKIRESPEIKVKVGLDASPKLEELLNIVAGRTRQKGKNPARGNTTQPNA